MRSSFRIVVSEMLSTGNKPYQQRFINALLILFPLIAFLPFVNALWLCDDFVHLQCFSGSPGVVLKHLLTGHIYSSAIPDPHFRPFSLTLLALLIRTQSPAVCHLASFAVHWATGLVLYVLLFRTERYRPWALFGYLLFMVHPMIRTSVFWISDLNDPLTTLFSLAASFCYLAPGQSRRTVHWVLALFWYSLAVFSKEMCLTLPVILAGISFLRGTFRKDRALAVALLACACGYLGVRIAIIGPHVMGQDGHFYTPSIRTVSAVAKYAYLMLVPSPQYLNYRYPALYLTAAPAVVLAASYLVKKGFKKGLMHAMAAMVLMLCAFAPVLSRFAHWYLYYPSVLFAWFCIHALSEVVPARFRVWLAPYILLLAGFTALHGSIYVKAGEFSKGLVNAILNAPSKQVNLFAVPAGAYGSAPIFPDSRLLHAALAWTNKEKSKGVIMFGNRSTDKLPDRVRLDSVQTDYIRAVLDKNSYEYFYAQDEPWEGCTTLREGQTAFAGAKSATVTCPEPHLFYSLASDSAIVKSD